MVSISPNRTKNTPKQTKPPSHYCNVDTLAAGMYHQAVHKSLGKTQNLPTPTRDPKPKVSLPSIKQMKLR